MKEKKIEERKGKDDKKYFQVFIFIEFVFSYS